MKNDPKIMLNNIDDDKDAYNDFYASVSVLFRIASFIFLVAFLIFIVFSAFTSQEAFTYENLEFVVRNFALTLEENRDDSVYAIKYNPDSSRNFALIGNKFTVCGNSGISIYSSTGRLTCSDSFAFKNPMMVASDKYALIYDSGNCDYVVYNSFSKVHSQTLEKPIRGACMSSNGYYAFITSSTDYNSTVEVYNDDFELVNRFNKTGYVVDVDMHEDQILITTVEGASENTFYSIQVLMYDIVKGETIADVDLDSSFPFSGKISSSGFFLVCSDEAITYNIITERHNQYSYADSIISDFELTYDKAALLLEVQGHDISYNYVVIDEHSSVLYDHNIDSTVYDIEFCGDYSCLLTDNRILVYNSEMEKTIEVAGSTTENRLLAYNSNALYLCTSSSAPLINIDE